MTFFQLLPEAIPDPILNMNKLYREDKNPHKISLSIGAYRDENGLPYLLPSIQKADLIVTKQLKPIQYFQNILGHEEFICFSHRILFGENSQIVEQKRIATIKTLSGSGALYLGFQLMHLMFPERKVYFPSPTWPNHIGIFSQVYGNDVFNTYTYINKSGALEIDFQCVIDDLEGFEDKSIIVFHQCAHNPTGVDFNNEQWVSLLSVFQKKQFIAFFDTAYQGIGSGDVEKDGYAQRIFCNAGVECVIAQSFAKNAGLYGERIGALHVVTSRVCNSNIQKLRDNMVQIKYMRWGCDPYYGSSLLVEIYKSLALQKLFFSDIKHMAQRIISMRKLLFDELVKLNVPGSWDYLIKCVGMFTHTGLNGKQVDYLREKHGVYLVKAGGRMGMCGLTQANVPYVARAMYDVVVNKQEIDGNLK